MLEKIKDIFNSVIALWNKVPLKWKGFLTAALPLVAVFISAIIGFYGNYQRHNIETDIQRKFRMVSAMSDALNIMVNAETGMRGYLLTRREGFLEPYNIAKQRLPETMSELRALAEAEPGEKPRIEKLESVENLQVLIEKQIADLDFQKNYVNTPDLSNTDIYIHLEDGKNLMDAIRRILSQMSRREENLLGERILEINDIRRRDYIGIFVVMFVGIGIRLITFYLFRVGILARIVDLTESLRAFRQQGKTGHPPTGKTDELGILENEIYKLEKK